MPVFYGYTNAIFGTQSTVNGSAFDYNFAPAQGTTWRYTGPDTYFVVNENDGATNFNGDATNEQVSPQEQLGGTFPQTVTIDGTERQIIYDYTFTVTDGTNVFRVSVIDVDLNNDNDLQDAGEDGYFLIFPDGLPPPDTDLTTGPIVDNSNAILHQDLGAALVCFADGTLIETDRGPQQIEDLRLGHLIRTRTGGFQPIRWLGSTITPATHQMAPVVIGKNVLGNTRDLVVSPQHALLLDDWRAELFFGQAEVLIRAIDLLGHDGVSRRPGGIVRYHHLLLDAHHLIRAEGAWAESLYPGEITRETVTPAACREIMQLFPDIGQYGPKAAPCLRAFEASCLQAV